MSKNSAGGRSLTRAEVAWFLFVRIGIKCELGPSGPGWLPRGGLWDMSFTYDRGFWNVLCRWVLWICNVPVWNGLWVLVMFRRVIRNATDWRIRLGAVWYFEDSVGYQTVLNGLVLELGCGGGFGLQLRVMDTGWFPVGMGWHNFYLLIANYLQMFFLCACLSIAGVWY